jgi:photosystem II stability/assembly factor-like uncharacterized protein
MLSIDLDFAATQVAAQVNASPGELGMTWNDEGRSQWMGRRRGRWAVLAAALAGVAAVALAGAAPPASAGTNFWTSLGPDGGFVSTVVADPANPQVLYAGSVGGVFKSVDGGASWRAASRGLQIRPVTALAVDPHQPGTVYAAAGDTTTLEVGLAVSRDGGATWSPTGSLSNGYARDGGEEFFSSLAVDPAHGGTVFAASNFAIYVSRDSGQDWSRSKDFGFINPQDGLSVQVVADPPRGSVFAYVAGVDLFGNANPYVKVLESDDGGATWIDHSAALPKATAAKLAIEPSSPGILYLLQDGKIFRSLDGAASWQEARSAGGPLAAGPHGLVVAGNRASGIVESTDGGKTWVEIATPPVDTITSYAFGAAPGQLYASGNALGVVASDDGGQSWQAANHGLTATSVLAVAVDPSRPARIYTVLADSDGALRTSGVFKTRNGGASWRPIGAELPSADIGLVALDEASLFVDPTRPDALLYSTSGFAARSADAGASWTPLPPLPSCLRASSIAPEPASPSILYAAASRCSELVCAAFESIDGGATWSCLPLARISRVVVAPSNPAIVYATGFVDSVKEHFLWRSPDAGKSWAPIDRRLPFRLPPYGGALALAVDPSDAQRLFVANTMGVWRSLDGGAHWSETDRGLPLATAAQFPFSSAPLLAVDPNNPLLVYAAANYLGVYRSLDGGNRWRPILAGLPPLDQFEGSAYFYEALMPDPRHSGTVYLATGGDGLLTYTAN